MATQIYSELLRFTDNCAQKFMVLGGDRVAEITKAPENGTVVPFFPWKLLMLRRLVFDPGGISYQNVPFCVVGGDVRGQKRKIILSDRNWPELAGMAAEAG